MIRKRTTNHESCYKEVIDIPREPRINQRIRIKEVRLVGPDGEQMGIVPTQDALQRAQEVDLDLVEVASQASPPVCRIMDYSKYKYDQEKKAKEARKHQKIVHLKEIKIKPNIEEHDYQVKLYHLRRFLARGDRAKLTMVFRGREMSHMDIGRKILDRVVSDLVEVGEVESAPKREGRSIIVNFIPRLKANVDK